MKKKGIEMDLNNLPVDGSLGLLAYGDLAFKAWREVKVQNRKIENEEE